MPHDYKQPYHWKEHIRKRPAMYVGNLKLNGFHNMLEYLMDELLEKSNEKVEMDFEFRQQNKIKIQARGIVPDNIHDRLAGLEPLVTGPVLLGFTVLIALSEEIKIELRSKNSALGLTGVKGDFKQDILANSDDEPRIDIEFTIDPEIFGNLQLDFELSAQFLKKFAYLNPKVCISIFNNADGQKIIYNYPLGLKHLLDQRIHYNYHSEPLARMDLNTSFNEWDFQISFCFFDYWPEKKRILSFTNNYETVLGGSHVNGVLSGIHEALDYIAFIRQKEIEVNKRKIAENILMAVSVKGENFSYAGSTKSKLETPELEPGLQSFVFEKLTTYLQENPEIADKVLHRFLVWD